MLEHWLRIMSDLRSMSSCPRRRALLSQRAAQAAQRLALDKPDVLQSCCFF